MLRYELVLVNGVTYYQMLGPSDPNLANLTFRRIEAARNYGLGLWFDTGNVNCLVTDSVIVDNTSQGVWSENNNRNNITPSRHCRPTPRLSHSRQPRHRHLP
jgi:hypothetical protein